MAEYLDRQKEQTFCRLSGGTIEFRKRGEEAVWREFCEEIAAESTDMGHLRALESIYVYKGQRGQGTVSRLRGTAV